MKPTLFFDLDGTVIDVWHRYYSIMSSFFENETRLPFPSLADYRRLKLSLTDDTSIIHRIYGKLVANQQDTMQRYKLDKSNRLESMDLLDMDTMIGDFPSFAAKVKGKYHLALITIRNHNEHVYLQLKRLMIYDLFDHIFVVAPLKGENPKQQALMPIVRSNDVIIGDSEIDIECGNRLGMRTFHVSTGLRSYEFATKQGPAVRLGNYTELSEFL